MSLKSIQIFRFIHKQKRSKKRSSRDNNNNNKNNNPRNVFARSLSEAVKQVASFFSMTHNLTKLNSPFVSFMPANQAVCY
jgi:hypothetical protein